MSPFEEAVDAAVSALEHVQWEQGHERVTRGAAEDIAATAFDDVNATNHLGLPDALLPYVVDHSVRDWCVDTSA